MMTTTVTVKCEYCTATADVDMTARATEIARLTAELAKAQQKHRDEVIYRISLGNDLIQQRDAALKDQAEIRELLGCTEDDDDFIGALRVAVRGKKELRQRIAALEQRIAKVEAATPADSPIPEATGRWNRRLR